MTQKPPSLPRPPALDLERMPLRDLCLLADMYEGLAEAALSFRNQPRFHETLADTFADALWDKYLNGSHARLVAEIERRTPADATEAELRANAIIRSLAGGDSYQAIAELAAEAMRARQEKAA